MMLWLFSINMIGKFHYLWKCSHANKGQREYQCKTASLPHAGGVRQRTNDDCIKTLKSGLPPEFIFIGVELLACPLD